LRWLAFAILDLGHIWTTHREYLGVYQAKFGYDRYRSVDNMNVLVFYAFGWKTPIHTPKIFDGGGGNLTP